MIRALLHSWSHIYLDRSLRIYADEAVAQQGLVDGHSLATAGMPPSEATAMEARLVAYSNGPAQRNQRHASKEVEGAILTLQKHEGPMAELSLDDCVGLVRDEVAKKCSAARIELDSLKRDMDVAEREYTNFGIVNELYSDPVYVENSVLMVCALFGAALLEAVLTFQFFAEDNPFGYVGGVIAALTVGISNVFFAFITGFFAFRNAGHVNVARARFWATVTVTFILMMILGHAALAWYRYQLSDYENLLTPIMLSFIGICGAGFSLYEGFVSFGTYWGHAEKHKRMVRTKRAVERARSKLEFEINGIVNSGEHAIACRMKKFELILNLVSDRIVVAMACVADCEQRAKRIAERFTELMTLYREQLYRMAGGLSAAYRQIPPLRPDTSLTVSSAELLAGKQKLQVAASAKRREADTAVRSIRAIGLQAVMHINAYSAAPTPIPAAVTADSTQALPSGGGA